MTDHRDPRCMYRLRAEGKAYPRTCEVCELGPCPYDAKPFFGADDMTDGQFEKLKPGDLIQHVVTGQGYLVVDRVGEGRGVAYTVVRHTIASNPREWRKVPREW